MVKQTFHWASDWGTSQPCLCLWYKGLSLAGVEILLGFFQTDLFEILVISVTKHLSHGAQFQIFIMVVQNVLLDGIFSWVRVRRFFFSLINQKVGMIDLTVWNGVLVWIKVYFVEFLYYSPWMFFFQHWYAIIL